MDMDPPPGEMATWQKNAQVVSAVIGRQDWSRLRQSILNLPPHTYMGCVCMCVYVK